ncbi:hypothetical protein W97_02520 [Coniosporium apollinis CBS 100218]|uniref:Uncharacterized protein n=1 Tax=Coniosporium apollinis (strain CBS 100218) TaxID=1168221 RepID=R7YN51_CONA1|nr:uncharacterized protein W97_02520 [Coniosporium apollinis CBS 100218]EON63293.1 hypothetical protein W97_02520 [Coniosporium apollinis CBS 100218]
MADPFTWGGVAWAIASGAIGWIGSKIMDGLFGTGSDPVELQAESIRRLALVFQKALEAERLQNATDKLRSLLDNIAEYNNAPSTSLFRLEDATTDSLDLLSTLAGLEYLGLPSYFVAVSVRITILQELHLVSGDNGELLSILRHIKRSNDQCEYALARGFDLYNGLITPPKSTVPGWIAAFKDQFFIAPTQAEVLEQVREASRAFRKAEIDPNEDLYDKLRWKWSDVREGALERAKAAGIEVPPGL